MKMNKCWWPSRVVPSLSVFLHEDFTWRHAMMSADICNSENYIFRPADLPTFELIQDEGRYLYTIKGHLAERVFQRIRECLEIILNGIGPNTV